MRTASEIIGELLTSTLCGRYQPLAQRWIYERNNYFRGHSK